MGVPPDASSILFWGRNRATTLMLFAFDMTGEGSWLDWLAQLAARVSHYHSTLALVGRVVQRNAGELSFARSGRSLAGAAAEVRSVGRES